MWVKKINPDWAPQEHPGILVGDVVDFPGNIEKLLKEGNIILSDEQGNEVSAFDTTGVLTDRELNEFKEYREMQKQEALKKSLEAERDTLLAEAEALKAEKAKSEEFHSDSLTDTKVELDQKRKDWGAKMAAARAAKKAEIEGANNA